MSNSEKPIKTRKVADRRKVRYKSLDNLLYDAERLASMQVRTLGNWSQGEIYSHVAKSLDACIDGNRALPAPLRWILSTFLKNRYLNQGVPAGFKAPGEFQPNEVSVAEGLGELRKAIQRQKDTSDRTMHPAFGKITNAEWDSFNLRHAEMHMSFLLED